MPELVNLHYGNLYDSDKYVQLRYNKYVKLISEMFHGQAKLLEIGCYTAELADLLPKNIEYFGVDFDEKAIEIAKAKGRNVYKMDFNTGELEFKERFDIIIAAEVLEHLLNPQVLMREIGNLLKDDGVILISLPNENTIYHRLMSCLGLGIDLYAFKLYKHLHFPTIHQSIRFVSGYFKIIKKEYYINPSAKGSRVEKFGFLFRFIPDFIWEGLAYLNPGCFARGIIILCIKTCN